MSALVRLLRTLVRRETATTPGITPVDVHDLESSVFRLGACHCSN